MMTDKNQVMEQVYTVEAGNFISAGEASGHIKNC